MCSNVDELPGGACAIVDKGEEEEDDDDDDDDDDEAVSTAQKNSEAEEGVADPAHSTAPSGENATLACG